MNATMAVMAREMMARRELLLLAVAAAVIVSLMPFMPGLESYDAEDVRTVGSNTLAVVLGWGLALLLGATVFGGDLSEGRLGFFFARPLSGFAVWWGRILAVLTLIWVVELIVLLPSFYGGGMSIFASREGSLFAVFGDLVMPLLLLLLAHAVSIMVRARTAWLFLDLAGFVVFTLFAWFSLLPFLTMFAQTALWVIAGALIAALLFALSVGGAFGVAVGRVDLRRTHGALSLALWATLAVCVAGVTVYAGWLRDFGPPDFHDVEVLTVAPDGRWVETIGWAPRRLDVSRRCLVSTTDNRWLLLPGHSWAYSGEVVYSRGGSTALWRGHGLGDKPRTLWWADLSRPDPYTRQTNLVVPQDAALALSDDGSRLAILEQGTLSVHELADEQLVTAVRLPGHLERGTVFFTSRNTVRLFARNENGADQSLRMAEVDVETSKVVTTGEIHGLSDESWVAVDASLEYLVTWTRLRIGDLPVKKVYDAVHGAFVKDVTVAGFPRFLQDGRLVMLAVSEDGNNRLVVEPVADGDHIVYELDETMGFELSGEAIPGGVVLSQLVDPSDNAQGLRVDLFDVDSGEVRNIGSNLRRGFPWYQWKWGKAGVIFWYGNQTEAGRFFMDQSGALVRWDPETGELIHVVGGRE